MGNPPPIREDIHINDELKDLGVTQFYKKGTILQIMIGEDKLLTVDIHKEETQKTLVRLEEAADGQGIQLGRLKFLLARDHAEVLRLPEKDNEANQKSDKDKEQTSAAVNAVNLVKKSCEEFFIDNLGQPYAAIKVGDHVEVHPIKGEKFKNWLTKLYFDVTVAEAQKQENGTSTFGDILSSESLIKVLRVLKAEADYSGNPRKELYLRVAKQGDTIYYDLTNSSWQAVKITPEGWSIVQSPILFRRYPHQVEQVIPTPVYLDISDDTGDIFDNFIDLLNISGNADNRLLFKCYIISLFYHGIVHAALMLHGEGGSAKTTLQEFIKWLVDPSAVLTLSISYDIESMAQKISHNYVCFLDNISKIPDIISDLLCRTITGTGFMKREIFTVDEEVIYQLRHCLGLTGVNLAATKSDLIDRGLIIEHKAIINKKRLITIQNKFFELRPKLLGYIFDILSKVLAFEKDHPNGLELENYPRLADFAEVGEIISRCMGNKETEFLLAFQRNIDSRHRRIVNDSTVGQALEIFMNQEAQKNGWEGSMSDLLPLLKAIAKVDLKLESVKNSKYWPQVPNSLSRRINEIKPSLRALGIDIERVYSDNTERKYLIKNKNIPLQIIGSPNISSISSPSSPSHAATSEKPNNANSDDTDDAGDTFGKPIKRAPFSDKKVAKLLGTYVAFDFEWDAIADNCIDAVSFVDSNGRTEVKLRNRDFNGSEIALLDYINTTILNYQWSVGWNTQGNSTDATNIKFCDLYILHKRCEANRFPSIVRLGNKGVPYLANSEYGHIDLMNVYRKPMVKDGMYNSYRTNALDDVSKALLGHRKYNNYSGAEFNSLPVEEQEKYSLVDSQLVMELSRHNDFEVLDAMLAISEITGLDFERVCRTNLSNWWSQIFDSMVRNGECSKPSRFEGNGTYKGAEVLTPKKGFYHNIVVVDAKSLYPSVGINYNLSFDTINCDCCKRLSQAKIWNIIPDEFVEDCKFINPAADWICRKKDGAFPTKLKVFKAERLKQKDLGNKAKQHALKILINGGYGVFGSGDYDYYDPRVAELVTATGRYELSIMQNIAKSEYGFEIIYGDTDSLFLNNTSVEQLKDFQNRFNTERKIELEIKNNYQKLLLGTGKKHYIGYEKGELDPVGFEGGKSDRPEYFHQVYKQLLDDIFKHEIDPIPNVRKAFFDLEANNIDTKLLQVSKVLSQNPEDYKSQSCQAAEIGKALGRKQGDLIEYYSSNKKLTGKSWTLNPADIDIVHYKTLLWNTISEILEIAGFPVTQLAQEFGIKSKKKRIKDNSIDRDKTDTGGEC